MLFSTALFPVTITQRTSAAAERTYSSVPHKLVITYIPGGVIKTLVPNTYHWSCRASNTASQYIYGNGSHKNFERIHKVLNFAALELLSAAANSTTSLICVTNSAG